MDLAYNTYLPECTIKYAHGLGASDNSMLVHSMVILFPDRDNGGAFLDFHAYPFNLMGKYPQFPALGALGLSIGKNNQRHDFILDQVIDALIINVSK